MLGMDGIAGTVNHQNQGIFTNTPVWMWNLDSESLPSQKNLNFIYISDKVLNTFLPPSKTKIDLSINNGI